MCVYALNNGLQSVSIPNFHIIFNNGNLKTIIRNMNKPCGSKFLNQFSNFDVCRLYNVFQEYDWQRPDKKQE